MQISAAAPSYLAPPCSVPRAPSSRAALSSCNSLFCNPGRKDLAARSKDSRANAVAMSRNRTQRGLNCRCLFGLGVPELAVIGGVALLLFGPKKLPDVGRSIGKTVKSFQQAAKEFETELKKAPEDSSDGSPEEKPVVNNEGEKQELEVSSTKESL